MGSRTLTALAAVVPACLALSGQATAQPSAENATQSLRAAADATVSSTTPSGRYGGERTLLVAGRPELRSYLRFRVPAGGRVTGATLRLYAASSHPATVTIRAASAAWGERSLAFARAPRPGKAALRLRIRRGGWVTVDVSRLAKRLTVGLVLTTSGARPVVFLSRENGARGPRLVVTRFDPPPPPVTVAAAGNIACDPLTPGYNGGAGDADVCHMKATSDLLLARKWDAVLALGDNQYECGSLSAYQQVFDPTWGRVKPLIRPVLGNHDYASPLPGTACDPGQRANGYFEYFGPAAGPQPHGYYSFDVGAWHVVALNSNCARILGGCDAGGAQERWLRADLAASKAKCTLAMLHHPRVSSSYSADVKAIQPLWQALYDARADVVLAAHDHLYERLAPVNPAGVRDDARGLRQFVVGTGGFSHHPFLALHPASEVRNNDTYGVLELELRATSYAWKFLPEAGKTFTDAGSAVCR